MIVTKMKVVQNYAPKDFEDNVNKALDQGWVPNGEMIVMYNKCSNTRPVIYIQQFIKYKL